MAIKDFNASSQSAEQEQKAFRLKIIIIGAGLSGLTAAIQCALSGHSVLVLEQAKELGEVGAGLQITPNSSRLLKRWGLSDTLWASVAKPTSLNIRRYSDGKLIYQELGYNAEMLERYGSQFFNIHRVDLQQALWKRAKELEVDFIFGAKIKDIDIDNARVSTPSSGVLQGDLVIGADGLWSRCREILLKRQDKPVAAGDLVYRIVLDLRDIPDADLKELVANPVINIWFGPDSHVVSYSLRAGTMLNIVLMCPDDLPPEVSRKEGSVEEMREIFSTWDPILTRFLDRVNFVEKWRLMHRPEMETWINPEGNFALIGDACHPMIPYLAQGANSSIEDGAVIGLLLGKVESKEQLPQAIRLYQRMRKRRGEIIAKESLQQRAIFQMHDGPEQEARDALFAEHMKHRIDDRFPLRWACPVVQPWLFGYDAFQEVEKALKLNPFESIGRS